MRWFFRVHKTCVLSVGLNNQTFILKFCLSEYMGYGLFATMFEFYGNNFTDSLTLHAR